MRVCEMRVCEMRVCKMRVCEMRVCEMKVGDESAKILAGYTGATVFESLHRLKRVIVILIPCMHLILSRLQNP